MSYLAIVVVLTWIGLPIITALVEGRDTVRVDVRRMADRDRRAHAVQAPQRRMLYAHIVKPALLQQHGSPRGKGN